MSLSALSKDIPKAFLCTYSHEIMKNPIIAQCSHLFDASVLANISACPLDGIALDAKNSYALNDLKKHIEAYQKSQEPVKSEVAWAKFSKTLREKKTPINEIVHIDVSVKKSPAAIKSTSVCNDVHDDDIHGLLKISKDQFISGSKDTTVKLWNEKGEFLKYVREDGWTLGYHSWITAMSLFDDDELAVGTRDGQILIYDKDMGSRMQLKFGNEKYEDNFSCKERNLSRINCLLKPSKGSTFYAGVPGFVVLYDMESQKILKRYKTGTQDWVYSIKALGEHDLLVATGADLERWQKTADTFKRSFIIQETQKQKHQEQRPLISHIENTLDDPSRVILTIFGGQLKLMNLGAEKCERIFDEHKGRVWMSHSLSSSLIASCSDDKTIKLWDIRHAKSCATVKDNPGRVSSLLKMDDHVFISASCPDDLNKTTQRASFSFWDLRYFNTPTH